jgi:CubicO group peptidase (beta-lactamase class C family)
MSGLAVEALERLAASGGWDERAERLRKQARLPALVVGVATGGRLAWSHATVAPELGLPAVSRDSVFRVASVTKWVTALAVLKLVESGRCELDERLARYLPELDELPVTVRQLLCHGSGLQREAPGEVGWYGERFLEGEALLASAREARTVMPAMQRWKYSNLGYQLLGLLVERVAGRPYEQVVEQELLRPAGMDDTVFGGSSRARATVLPGYRRGPRDEGFEPAHDEDVVLMRAAGNLCSSVADLARLTGGVVPGALGALLGDDALRAMYAPQIMLDEGWTAAWGLGPALERRDGVLFGGHGGSVATASSTVLLAPAHDVGVVALANVGASQLRVRDLARDLLAEACAAAPAPAPVPALPRVPGRAPAPAAPVDAQALGSYCGCGMTLTLSERDGCYAARWHHGSPDEVDLLVPLGDDAWLALDGDWTGEVGRFTRDERGAIVAIDVTRCLFERIDRPTEGAS